MARELIDVTVQLRAKTERAVLVSDDGEEKFAVWLPLSQVEVFETKQKGVVEVTMPEWLALEKGLI